MYNACDSQIDWHAIKVNQSNIGKKIVFPLYFMWGLKLCFLITDTEKATVEIIQIHHTSELICETNWSHKYRYLLIYAVYIYFSCCQGW